MYFRRVFTGTALVAVLLSSLFSGFLVESIKAAGDPIDETCSKADDKGLFIGNTSAKFTEVSEGFNIDLSLEADSNSKLNPSAKLYKKKASDSLYKEIGIISLTKTNGTPFVSNDKWLGSFKDTYDLSFINSGNYILLVNSVFGSTSISKCFSEKKIITNSGGFSAGEIKAWFSAGANSSGNIDGPTITVYDEQNSPPKVIISKSKLGNIPGKDLTFKLVAYSGEGAITYRNKDWLTFQGYFGSEKIDSLYLSVSDNIDANVHFTTSFDTLKKGFSDNSTEVGRIQATEGSPFEISVGKLFTYIMNVPLLENGTPDPDDNCGSPGSQKEAINGPKNAAETAGATQPDISNTTEKGVNGTRARLLNQNCSNVESNGWLAYWGVDDRVSADPGLECGLSSIGSLDFTKIIVRVISCMIGATINSAIKPIQGFTNGAADEANSLEAKLTQSEEGLVTAWRYSLSLINIVVILALLAIAFANVFHLNLNTYAAKKALPGLVVGVVGANASLLIIRFIIDVVQALMNLSFTIASTAEVKINTLGELMARFISILGGGIENIPLASGAVTLLVLFVLIVVVVYFLVLLVLFAFALVKRTVMIYFLIVVAPLAFISYGVPTMSQWFAKWWDQFLRMAFMLPILFLAVALYTRYAVELGISPKFGSISSGDISPTSDIFSVILGFAAATMILKLPGALTKGAIDMEAMSKKAFGIAKNSPSKMYGNAQGIAGGFEKKYKAKEALATTDADKARYKKLAKKWGNTKSVAAGFRGRSYAISSPDKTIVPWMKGRGERFDKGSLIESAKMGVGMPGEILGAKMPQKLGPLGLRYNVKGLIMGGEEEYNTEKDFLKDQIQGIQVAEQARPILSSDGAKALEKALMDHEEKLSGKDLELWRAKTARLWDGRLSDWEDVMNEAGVDPSLRGTAADKRQVAGYRYGTLQGLRRSRGKGSATLVDEWNDAVKGFDPTAKKPLGSYDASSNPPSGTAQIPVNSPVYQQSISDQTSRALQQAALIKSSVAPEARIEAKKMMDEWKDALIGATDGVNFDDMKERTAQTLGNVLDLDVNDIRNRFANITDASTFADITENIVHSLEAGVHQGNFETDGAKDSLQSRIAGGHQNEQAIQETSREIVASIKPEDLAAIQQGNMEVLERVANSFNNQIETLAKKTGQAPTADHTTKFAQIMKDSLQQAISGPQPKSLKNAITGALNMHAKDQKIQGSAQAHQIEQAIQDSQQTTPPATASGPATQATTPQAPEAAAIPTEPNQKPPEEPSV